MAITETQDTHIISDDLARDFASKALGLALRFKDDCKSAQFAAGSGISHGARWTRRRQEWKAL